MDIKLDNLAKTLFDDIKENKNFFETKYVIVPSSTTFMTIDVNTLEDGLHSICFQAMDNKFSNVEKRFFYNPQNEAFRLF